MEYIGDDEMNAPTLNTVSLQRSQAKRLLDRVIQNIEVMLTHNRIHADLSAFNILYWEDEIRLIDFPQAIHPDENPNAFRIFERDVTRICEYFARQGVRRDAQGLARDLWRATRRRTTPDIDPLYLDPDDPQDRSSWERRGE
jgi:RIO kinase 1